MCFADSLRHEVENVEFYIHPKFLVEFSWESVHARCFSRWKLLHGFEHLIQGGRYEKLCVFLIRLLQVFKTFLSGLHVVFDLFIFRIEHFVGFQNVFFQFSLNGYESISIFHVCNICRLPCPHVKFTEFFGTSVPHPYPLGRNCTLLELKLLLLHFMQDSLGVAEALLCIVGSPIVLQLCLHCYNVFKLRKICLFPYFFDSWLAIPI